jgi:hypothetical protein
MIKRAKKRSEAEIIDSFGLEKTKMTAPALVEWLDASVVLDNFEQAIFSRIRAEATEMIEGWNEEDLKMNFIAFVIDLANLKSNKLFRTYYEKTVEAVVDGIYLKTKTDFMIAKGVLDLVKIPYFHFQEYKKEKDPKGDPTAQLLEAFLIAQEKNKSLNRTHEKPLYGVCVVGRLWYFVTMEGKNYCVSKSYDSTEEDDLLLIIAILRKFRYILETRLLD